MLPKSESFSLGDQGEALVRFGLDKIYRDIRPVPHQIEQQLVWGDLVVPGVQALGLKHYKVEVKTEKKWTGNIFWEWWSNKEQGRPGWGQTTPADALYYLFWDDCTGLRLPSVQTLKWLIDYYRGDFKLVQQKKYDQENESWGYLVPVEWLYESNEALPFDFRSLRQEWEKEQ